MRKITGRYGLKLPITPELLELWDEARPENRIVDDTRIPPELFLFVPKIDLNEVEERIARIRARR